MRTLDFPGLQREHHLTLLSYRACHSTAMAFWQSSRLQLAPTNCWKRSPLWIPPVSCLGKSSALRCAQLVQAAIKLLHQYDS